MKRVMLLAIATVGMLVAQGGPPPPPDGAGPGEGGPGLTALQTALNITEDEAQELATFVREQREAARESMQSVMEQLRENQEQLREMLEAGDAEPAAVGTLVIENHALGEQIKASRDDVQDAIANYVNNTLGRATELAELQAASEQMPAAQQARRLGLLTPPEGGAQMQPMRGGPGGGGPAGGMGLAGFGPRRGPAPR